MRLQNQRRFFLCLWLGIIAFAAAVPFAGTRGGGFFRYAVALGSAVQHTDSAATTNAAQKQSPSRTTDGITHDSLSERFNAVFYSSTNQRIPNRSIFNWRSPHREANVTVALSATALTAATATTTAAADNCITTAESQCTRLVGSADISSSALPVLPQLSYLQTMLAGAVSRTIAQTIMHPANTYKTLLQINPQQQVEFTASRLLRGIDAQFLLSLPHGAFHFFVIDQLKLQISTHVLIPQQKRLLALQKQQRRQSSSDSHSISDSSSSSSNSDERAALRLVRRALLWQDFAADFLSSALSTLVCSVVSTPQMVLTDRLMAGVYPSLPAAVKSILQQQGPAGFYAGWFPALAQKIPSYGLTWMFFQQLKHLFGIESGASCSSDVQNFALGAVAAAMSVTVMIPMDTIKTRLVVQQALSVGQQYSGVADCLLKILRSEGVGALYCSLPPRLISVVPMIAIQFGVYETMKSSFLRRNQQLQLEGQGRLSQQQRRQRLSLDAGALEADALAAATDAVVGDSGA